MCCHFNKLTRLCSHRGAALIIEHPAALQLSVQLAFRSELQDEVDARRVMEVTVQAQDVGMPVRSRVRKRTCSSCTQSADWVAKNSHSHTPEMRLDLHLSPQLVLHAGFLQLLFKKHLQGQDELCLSLSGQVHASELALPESPANVEVLQTPRLPEEQGVWGWGGDCQIQML